MEEKKEPTNSGDIGGIQSVWRKVKVEVEVLSESKEQAEHRIEMTIGFLGSQIRDLRFIEE